MNNSELLNHKQTVNKNKTAVLVLANLMDTEGRLNDESADRANKAAQLFSQHNCDFLITSGWDYRSDSSIKIADAMRDYLIEYCGMSRNRIIAETSARDTVGDAVFVRESIVSPRFIKRLYVVTSIYHVARVQEIFHFFYNAEVEIVVVGVVTKSDGDSNILAHEQTSIQAFRDTFKGIDASDQQLVVATLLEKHPFYNGEVFPRFPIKN